MARNFSFLKRRWFWILLAAGVVGVFVIVFWQGQGAQGPVPASGADRSTDSVPPLTAIVSPRGDSWHNARFTVEIQDSDLDSGFGDAGTSEKRCEYFIEDLGTQERRGDYRLCGKSLVQVLVGPEQACSSSYDSANMSSGRCLVYTRAFDLAGNDSGWKGTLFNIDLIPPNVGSIMPTGKIAPSVEYLFETQVSDNNHISGCSFYVDGGSIDLKTPITPTPCEDSTACLVSARYAFEDTGTHRILFGCKDAAGNVGYGVPVSVDVFANSSPEVSFCRVTPAQGDATTYFQFSLDVQDIDEDALEYEWDFGDGTTSKDLSPSHGYPAPGVYRPKVIVQDNQGATASCATAWVVIQE